MIKPKATKSETIDMRLLAEFGRAERDPRETTRRAIAAIVFEYNILARH